MDNRRKNMDEIIVEENTPDNKEVKETSIPEPADPQESLEVEEPKESAGIILKREREAQGLSLEIVHEVTKIPLDALRAIEEGYTIRMLSPFYYKGFVKMYASYLHIDASEVIDDYRQEELPKHIDQDMEEFEAPQWITKAFTRERKRQILIAAGIILALILLFKIAGFLVSRKPPPPVEKNIETRETVKKEIKQAAEKPLPKVREQAPEKIIPKEEPKIAPKIAPNVVPPAPKPVKSASVPPVVPAQKNITLTVRANQNSWLRVRTDGEVVFQSTLRPGAVETWLADSEIEISGRNINQLEFELNGKMIGTLGRRDRNAKKVIVTKNGLSVQK